MGHTETVIRIIALVSTVVLFPCAVLFIFRLKDRINDKLDENKKSERKKINGKKKKG